MLIELDKKNLIQLVNTTHIYPNEVGKFLSEGRIIFMGNQQDRKFEWNQNYLNSLEEETLWNIYLRYRKKWDM